MSADPMLRRTRTSTAPTGKVCEGDAFGNRLEPNVTCVVTPRDVGGYLAVSAPGENLRIGVLGETETEAMTAFDIAAQRWVELLEIAAAKAALEGTSP